MSRILPCLLLLGFAASSEAKTITVTPSGSGDAEDIVAAVNLAENGDVVELSAGTYFGTGNRAIDLKGKAITIRGATTPEATIINCGDGSFGFLILSGEGPETVLENFTVENGRATTGAGIWISGSSPTLHNVRVEFCTALNQGGGIYILQGNPTIDGCVLFGNQAQGTGGGGIYAILSDPVITGCRFEGDRASGGDGGGLYLNRSGGTVEGCTFLKCEADRGAALAVAGTDHPQARIQESLFIENAAAVRGGALYLANDRAPELVSCTIANNEGLEGSGILCAGSSAPVVERCIVAMNVGGAGIACSGSSVPVVSCSLLFGNHGGDDICGVDAGDNESVDPFFCDPATRQYTLAANSRAAATFSACGERIGSEIVACPGVPVEPTTWGRVKLLRR